LQAAIFDPIVGLKVGRVERPLPLPGEVLIKVEACGVCGSDKQILAGAPAPVGTQFPVILGHEISGRIVELGDSVADWSVGDPVIVHPFLACGKCRFCLRGNENLCNSQRVIGYHRSGGFAQYVTVPVQALVRRPDSMTAETSALLVDAFATPFHALVQVAKCTSKDRLLILGSGGLGMAALMIAKALPVQEVAVVVRREEAGEACRLLGADKVWMTSGNDRDMARDIRRWSRGGADIVLDTLGTADSVERGMEFLAPGGRMSIVGMTPDMPVMPPITHWVRRGMQISGSYGSTIEDVRTLVTWVNEKRLIPDVLISKVLPLTEIAKAFVLKSAPGRMVIRPAE